MILLFLCSFPDLICVVLIISPPIVGDVYIADIGNNRIRKVTVSTGTIATIAGSSTGSYSGDNGPATAAKLSQPSGVVVDSAGNIYIADYENSRIRKIKVSTGIIVTIAGNGDYGYSGDGGAATSAALNLPLGVALDSSGNVYVADSTNNRIRKLTGSGAKPTYFPTYAPSAAHIISFEIAVSVANWPYSYITTADEGTISSLVTDIIDSDQVQVSFQNVTEQSNRRRQLVSYILPFTINVTAMSTSQYAINKNIVNKLTTTALVSALNSACGCTTYSSVAILFISADGYCVDANTPSRQCSFGRIKINPFLSSVADYAFYDTAVSAVDFGACISLTEIGASAFENTYMETLDILACAQLISISEYAFAGTDLKRIKLPQDLNFNEHVFEDTPLEEIYCEEPYTNVNYLRGIGWGHNVLVIGCLGYTSDYFLYPHFSVTPWMTTIIIAFVVTFVVLHTLTLVQSLRDASVTFVLVSLLASLDLGSDVFHLLFSLYSTKELYFASFVFVFCMPIVYFVLAVIVQHNLVPHVLYEWYIGRIISHRCKWNMFWLWLSNERGAPLVNHKRQSYTFNNHDSIPKVIVFIGSWIILLGLQAISLIPFFLWMLLLSPYYIFLLLPGSFLFQTKLLAHKNVWNVFVLLFTGRHNRYTKTSMHDTKLLNDAMFAQLILTSLPSFAIKIINYLQNGDRYVFTALSTYNGTIVFTYYDYLSIYWPFISLLVSAMYCLVGSYRYVFLALYYKYLIQEVPFTFQYTVNNRRNSVGIAKTKEDIKYNKEAIVPYRRYWKDKILRTSVDCSMNAAMRAVSRFYIKDERFANDLDKLLKLRVQFVQSTLEATKRNVLDEGTCTVDTHQLGNKVFELLLRDSIDVSMYTVLSAAGVRQPSDLLDIDRKTVMNILKSLHNRAIYGTVLAYLNLITYNNVSAGGATDDGVDDINGFIMTSRGDEDTTGRIYPEGDSNVDIESSIGTYATKSRDVEAIDSSINDDEAYFVSKPIVNNPAARKIKSRTIVNKNIYSESDSNKVIVNDPTLRKVKKSTFFGGRDSAKQYVVHDESAPSNVGSTPDRQVEAAVEMNTPVQPFRFSSDQETSSRIASGGDTAPNEEEVSWNVLSGAKKGWF